MSACEKLVFLGDRDVGKESLAIRLTRNEFSVEPSNFRLPYYVHTMTVYGHVVKLQLWATTGRERSRPLAPYYYEGASGALVVFDVSNASSFEAVQSWIDELETVAAPLVSTNFKVILVGNKIDLADRAVDPDRITELSQRVGAPYFEASAKTGEGVKEAFEALVRSIIMSKRNDNDEEELKRNKSEAETRKCLIN